jgi:hypothetical protein
VTTKTVRDGAAATFSQREWDESGAGTGPYSAMPVLGDGAGVNAMGAVTASPAANTLLGRLKDLLSLIVLAAGANYIGHTGHGKTIKTVSGSITATTDIIALVAAKRIKVIAYSIITSGTTAAAYIFKRAGTTEVWRVAAQAPAAASMFGANLAIAAPSFLFATAAGEKLTLAFSTGSDTIHYAVTYFDDDAT